MLRTRRIEVGCAACDVCQSEVLLTLLVGGVLSILQAAVLLLSPLGR